MHLKEFQESILEKLDNYLDALKYEYREELDIKEVKKGKSYQLEEYLQKIWSKF